MNEMAARMTVDLLKQNNGTGKETTIILPVGPLLYETLADLCNKERVALDKLTVFMMDEYLEEDGVTPIPESHPLSFKAFMRKSFVSRLDPSLGFSMDRVVFPLPEVISKVSDRIVSMGGVDLCFGGVGISGHLAFNDPPEMSRIVDGASDSVSPQMKTREFLNNSEALDWVRNCPARVLTINRESCTQMAMGGTHGNWSIIPAKACTLGMRELLASKRICVCAMRTWHAGTIRRALFGPVSADCPGSLLQEHPNVEILMTEIAALPPIVNITLDTGEED
ncbi:MAG: sugar phosphate isomerase family [Armatimonadota bacterium]